MKNKISEWWESLPPQDKREIAASVKITLPYLAQKLKTAPATLTLAQVAVLVERGQGAIEIKDFLK